jgi:branched-chain amino acid transport system ATP-binding protein
MVLIANAVSKSFGGFQALNNLSVQVNDGEIIGLIGPNGAGKTTFFNIISGFLKPDDGTVTFNGQDITGLAPHRICKKGIARTFQSGKPFREANLLQNVLVGAIYGTVSGEVGDPVAQAVATLEIVGLRDKKDLLASSLDLAGTKRLEIARALATNPKLLLLDEVMAGLDNSEAESTLNLIRQIRDRNVSVIVVEHIMRLVTSVADRIIVLDHGMRIAEGNPQEVLQKEAVISAYLGQSYAHTS